MKVKTILISQPKPTVENSPYIQLKIKRKVKLIDDLKIDGDFIESQAFAYLAIRSFLGLPISSSGTTGCSLAGCKGGVLVKNY